MGRHRPEVSETGYRPRYSERFEFRHAAPKKGKRKMRAPLWARLCVIFGTILFLLSATSYAAEWIITDRYLGDVARSDLLGSNRRDGPPPVKGPLTFLILGTDTRSDDDYDPNDPSSNTWVNGDAERADTIILVHIPKNMKNAYLLSIPRDSYVYIPESDNGEWEGGKNKINSAMAFGKAPLMVSTVNKLLGVQIDYPVIANFQAVRELTEAVGGVDVVVDNTVQDYRTLTIFKKGKQRLDGKKADAYVRQRKAICDNYYPVTDPDKKGPECSLERGDHDRQARQQQFIRAVTEKLEKDGLLGNISKLDDIWNAISKHIKVDKEMPVSELLFSLKHLRPGNATYLVAPVAESNVPTHAGSAELLDLEKLKEFGEAINKGTVPSFIAKNPDLKNDATSGS